MAPQSVSPPQNVEAEQMLLASLMDVDRHVPDIIGQVQADDFYREGHRRIYEAIVDLFNTGEPIEPITVIEQLTKTGGLEVAGGRLGVLEVMESPYIAASFKAYAEIVRDTATQRRLLAVGQEIEALVAGREGETGSMVQAAEDLVFGLSQKRVRGDFESAGDLVVRSMERLVEASERGSEITGLPTGFIDLDRTTGGLRPSNLVVVAARPSMGKTAFALGIAEHVALEENGSVAVFSLEMSGEELVQRFLSSAAMVDSGRVRNGRLGPEDWPRISHAADRLANSRLFIDDSEGMSVAEMRTKARRLKSREGLDLVIVDYIQLMEGPRARRDENRVQELSTISRSLKMLARDLAVPLICISQLNRGPDARTDKRPLLSDLRESGAIEQDADLVLMIYRDDYYDPNSEEKGVAEINVAKNRNGPVDRVKVTFMANYAKFGSIPREH
jgi:replicative DNA helicase